MIRKRKPGGGRKPKGSIRAKSEVFTTRITPETREALEREAKLSGQSVSQAAERLLILGMETRRQRQNYRSLRALCFLIKQLAKMAGGSQWSDINHAGETRWHRKSVEKEQDEWLTNPFRYKAFTIAVQSLFEALKPKGEIKPPFSDESIDQAAASFGETNSAFVALMKNVNASPENSAAYHFSSLWAQLNRQHPLSEREIQMFRRGEWVGDMIREDFYGLQDARRDLGLGSQSEENRT